MQNPAKRWETLRRSLRVCHDAIDAGLSEIQNIAKLSNEDDVRDQLKEARRSIQDNIKQANQLTDEMTAICGDDPLKSAQLSRLEAVTANYSQEFHQAFQTVEQKIERRKLLRHTVVGNPQDLESGKAEEQRQLMRENDAITSSLDMLSNAIAQGGESINSLTRQQDRFVGVGKTLQQFTQRFPHLRSVMSRIHRAKLKETIILAAIVSCCLLFTVWFMFK